MAECVLLLLHHIRVLCYRRWQPAVAWWVDPDPVGHGGTAAHCSPHRPPCKCCWL